MRLTLGVAQRVDLRAATEHVVAVAANAVTHCVAFVLEGVAQVAIAPVYDVTKFIGLLICPKLHPPHAARVVWVLLVQHRRRVVSAQGVGLDLLRGTPLVDLRDTLHGLRDGDLAKSVGGEQEVLWEARRGVDRVAELVDEVVEAE